MKVTFFTTTDKNICCCFSQESNPDLFSVVEIGFDPEKIGTKLIFTQIKQEYLLSMS